MILENEETLKTSLSFVFALTELLAPVIPRARFKTNKTVALSLIYRNTISVGYSVNAIDSVAALLKPFKFVVGARQSAVVVAAKHKSEVRQLIDDDNIPETARFKMNKLRAVLMTGLRITAITTNILPRAPNIIKILHYALPLIYQLNAKEEFSFKKNRPSKRSVICETRKMEVGGGKLTLLSLKMVLNVRKDI
uniref:Uncharacterized protein n=1 Tax=Glossina pallidipes TaxID=7398 RepID=A0A1A9ZT00_GLOPL